ncbi:hypothetical protein KAR91_51050 [Candidatus Pacearchaeota archaeon]|nr:hypothetical protein [Candidatus Pacearchaeota archaeon]
MSVTIQQTLNIPVDSILSNKQFRTDLDGKFYLFDFRFNSRATIWMMNIYDENGSIIISGIALLLGVDLLGRFQDSRLPPGPLFMLNLKDSNIEASRDDFGQDVLLLYGKTT